MQTKDIIATIRQKYVGTAAEHDLLMLFERDIKEIESAIDRRYLDEWKERMEALSAKEQYVTLIVDGSQIDYAVFKYLQSADLHYGEELDFESVVYAMRGRGLNAIQLRKIADRMEEIEA